MINRKTLKLLLEEVEQEHIMEEVAKGLTHVVQLVAHKIAKKYASSAYDIDNTSEDQIEQHKKIINTFLDVFRRELDSETFSKKPEGINTRMIANEFDKLIK